MPIAVRTHLSRCVHRRVVRQGWAIVLPAVQKGSLGGVAWYRRYCDRGVGRPGGGERRHGGCVRHGSVVQRQGNIIRPLGGSISFEYFRKWFGG